MAFMEWSDELSVGIDLIDRQHKILIRAINLLAMAIEHKSSNELLSEIFDTLIDYADTHFAYEEELFDQFGYPDAEPHKAQHQALLKQVIDLQDRWQKGEAGVGVEVLRFLVDWLRKHILGTDQKYSKFLIAALHDAGLDHVIKPA